MADAKKCDICGKFYAIPTCSDMIRIYSEMEHYNGDYIDLCDDCYKKLCDFIRPAIPEGCPVERKRLRL